MMINLLWAFGSLVFFKVALDATFRSDVAIVAALLMAATVPVWLHLLLFKYATLHGQYVAKVRFNKEKFDSFLKASIGPFAFVILLNTIVCFGIIYGFSKQVSREVFSAYRSDENIFYLGLLVNMPLFAHYLLICIGAFLKGEEIRLID